MSYILNFLVFAAFPLALAGYGGHLAAKVLEQNQRSKALWIVWCLAGSGVLFAGIQQIVAYRSDRKAQADQIRRDQDIETLHGQLNTSLQREEYTRGQLDSISRVLGTLSANSNPGQLALALRNVIPVAAPPDDRTALQKMSNKKLKDSVITFAGQLRTLTAQNQQQESAVTAQWMATNRANGQLGQQTDAQKQASQQAWDRMTQRETALSDQFRSDYNAYFAVDAINYRDELVRRLGPQIPLSAKAIRIPLSLDGWLAPMSVDASAFYLETLAKQLPD